MIAIGPIINPPSFSMSTPMYTTIIMITDVSIEDSVYPFIGFSLSELRSLYMIKTRSMNPVISLAYPNFDFPRFRGLFCISISVTSYPFK